MWYLGEVVTDLDGRNSIQVKVSNLKKMGIDEDELMNWLLEEEEENARVRERE